MSANPIELVDKATGKLVAFACGKCHVVASSPKMYIGTQEECEAAAREAARAHCGPWFCACGAEREHYSERCRECAQKKRAADSAASRRTRFDAAKKIAAEDWDGEYLWDEGSEAIYSHPEDILDLYECSDREPPEYAEDCDKHVLSLDARDIIDRAVEEHEFHDEAASHVSAELMAELQAALDAWCEKARIDCWKPNGRLVMLKKRKVTT